MLKKISFLAAASILVFGMNVFAESMEEAEQKCKQYAAEDQITADEMDNYLTQCIEDLSGERSEESEETSIEEESEETSEKEE